MKSPALVPYPRTILSGQGGFRIDGATEIVANSPQAIAAAQWFRDHWHALTGLRPELVESPRSGFSGAGSIVLIQEAARAAESYSLDISVSRIALRAGDAGGFTHGMATLLQCAPWHAGTPSELPVLRIEDAPCYAWRGVMLDSARYFQPVAFIEKFIDLLALHKYNVLHWHLTEDQGWRFESKKYPELTAIGAWRSQSRAGHERDAKGFDGRPHGGFYSQQEMRDLVAYAAARGIAIVPEIEMPGHCESMLAAFPHLSCTGGPFEVSTKWGIHEDVFCAGNDAVFEFLEGVLEEVLDVFSSPIIHIGGDECRKNRWKSCPKCQERIRSEGLADEHELQSYFIRRIEKFLTARGRRLLGWDEILEGGLAPGATVMSWRGIEGGVAAAKAGHDVIMSSNKETYFDYYQVEGGAGEPLAIGGFLPLEKVYAFNPVPAELNASEAKHVLGGQGQLWTEYMPHATDIEYMAFPRACALAEALWSTPEPRDFADFEGRLKGHLALLDRLNVNYRPLDK